MSFYWDRARKYGANVPTTIATIHPNYHFARTTIRAEIRLESHKGRVQVVFYDRFWSNQKRIE